jgi:integrase/recombinase XerD
VNGCLTYRAATTKTKRTRQVPIVSALREALNAYRAAWEADHGHAPAPSEALVPAAGSTTTPQTRQAADKALRITCTRLGFEGVSTHTFRRSLAQSAVGRGVPLHVVQKLTGHKSLGSLGEYLSATEAKVLAAIGGWPRPWASKVSAPIAFAAQHSPLPMRLGSHCGWWQKSADIGA